MAGQRSRNAKYRKRTRRRRVSVRERQMQLIKRAVVFVLFLCIVIFGVMIVQGIRGKDANVTKKGADKKMEENGDEANLDNGEGVEVSPTPSVAPVADIKIKISAVGDCTLGTDKDFEESKNFDTMYANVGDSAYFFQNVKSILEQDDLTIANLEGPLTTSEDEQEKEFAFRGSPEYVNILKNGSVEATNIANNHIYDYGKQGFDDTITNLNSASITPFGYDMTVVKDINGAKVGLVGIYVLADEMERVPQLKEKIAEVKSQGAALTIVTFHWGIEKDNYPNRVQQDLAHMAIDEGADLVVGHHPHVLQGIEKYKGKNIVYSLGNFCFGGNSDPYDYDTMIFQQTFTIQGDKVVADDDVNIIPCSISSEEWYNNYQPTPAQGEEKIRIENKIKEFSEGIGSER